MKLAEALILRADSQRRLEQLKQRILRNAKVQEGEKPAENPDSLLEEVERICSELTRIIQRINATNTSTFLEDSTTVADAIVIRDILKLRESIYRELAHAAIVTQDRYTKSEVKFKSTITVSEIQKRADDLAKEHRELDAKIQAVNWQADLIE
jgi:N-methylhydantoinase B/oxoprolinase/acetone carboxylase alpha subunit